MKNDSSSLVLILFSFAISFSCKQDPLVVDISSKAYRIKSIQEFKNEENGFRPYFEEKGMEFSENERIYDSASTDLIIMHLTETNHRLVEKIIAEAKGSESGNIP